MAITLRNYRCPEDIDLQNAFWMQATRELPWCWKPTISPYIYVFASPLRRPGVVVAPGESTLTRMPVPFKSSAQLRAKFRIAAFVALYTLKAGVPMEPVVDPVSMTEPPDRINGSAFCTVNKVPLTFTSKTLSNCSSLIAPKGLILPIPALANRRRSEVALSTAWEREKIGNPRRPLRAGSRGFLFYPVTLLARQPTAFSRTRLRP
jgi:hypothetical protein